MTIYDSNNCWRHIVIKDLLNKLKKRMNPKHFDMLYCRYAIGFSGNEMAKQYNTTRNNVESTLCQAKIKAREILKKLILEEGTQHA